jgi:TolB protein
VTLGSLWAVAVAVCAASFAGASEPVTAGSRPQGDELAFVRLRPTSRELLYEYEVWVRDVRRRRARLVAGSRGSHEEPSWSPNGATLAYTESRASGRGVTSTIHVVRLDGTSRRALTDGSSPAWSPDGREIAYVHASSAPDGGLDGIRAVSADGARIRHITSGWDYAPTWSPTGTMIAFGRGGALFVVGADGAGERQLTAGATARGEYTSGFAWSPDARRILYTRDVEDRYEASSAGGTYLVNADGSGRRLLRRDARGLSWSPDGRRIAIVRSSARSRGIFLMRDDGRILRRLTRGLDGHPVWSPDGRRIAFERHLPGRYEPDIWVVDVDGTAARNVTRTPAREEHIAEWRPLRP